MLSVGAAQSIDSLWGVTVTNWIPAGSNRNRTLVPKATARSSRRCCISSAALALGHARWTIRVYERDARRHTWRFGGTTGSFVGAYPSTVVLRAGFPCGGWTASETLHKYQETNQSPKLHDCLLTYSLYPFAVIRRLRVVSIDFMNVEMEHKDS